MERKTHTIDASGRVLGRLAGEIVILLQGKHRPDFMPNKDEGDFVVVKNADKIKLTGRKEEQKIYYRHTGFLGGLKKTPAQKILKKEPAAVLKKAVFGMLPKNKLRMRRIKRLKIE
jgi:large subunit ribosomal protein L13